jgi:hypothetical protein
MSVKKKKGNEFYLLFTFPRDGLMDQNCQNDATNRHLRKYTL